MGLEAYLRSRGLRLDRSRESQFSDAWFIVAGLFFGLGLFLRLPALVHMAVLMLSIVTLAWLWTTLALWRVRFHHLFSERRAFVGETVTLRLRLENRKPLPLLWLRVVEHVPDALPVAGVSVGASHRPRQNRIQAMMVLRWFQRVDRVITVTCRQRGYYAFGPVDVEAGDPFGFFIARRRVMEEAWLIVYPRVEPLSALGLPAKNPLGDTRADVPLFEDPVRTVGVRDYQPQDDFRRVHWKASARRQRLQSKVYEHTYSHNVVVVLNVATLTPYWAGVIPSLLERGVSVAASIAYYAAEQRWPVGLIANGVLPRSDQPLRVPPGRGPGQLTLIFETLAAVTPIVSTPITDLLRRESPRMPLGATFVVISAIVDDDLVATLQDLRHNGRRVVLISLAEDPPPVEDLVGIVTYHLPWHPQEEEDVVDAETLAAAFAYPEGGVHA